MKMMKILKITVTLSLLISGFGLVAWGAGWKVSLGVFLIVCGNNADRELLKGQRVLRRQSGTSIVK